MYFREGFPSVAYYIPDKSNLGGRIPFKCRIAEEQVQAFSQSMGGLVDIGLGTVRLIAYKELKFNQGAKVLWNNVLYSVESIVPYIPDPSMQGFTKKRLQVEYIITMV